VTFLFTDIVGSTALNRRVGDEAYAGLLERHREIIVGAIDRAGGQIFGTEGDATFAVFAAADDACAGATGIVRGLRDEPWQGDNDVHVRVGLHSGRALVVRDDYTGATVHLAARVASTAHADQIVASDTTVSLAPEPEWHDLGVHRLKDIERPQRIWQLAAAGLPQDFPPLPTARNVPNNLPDPRDAFIGRDSELRDVRDSLADGPLTTLVGPGGVGKTRLASESARRALGDHPGGVHFVALAGVAGDEGVEAAVRRTMSLPDRTDLDLAGAVNSATAGEAALVILDNCEHLLDGASTVVRSLLDGCPQVRLLCTSREPLQVRSERVRWVEPLRSDTSDGISPAEELFLTRAEAATGRVTPDRELPLVRELVAALDGLPLAIELAAARTRGLALVDVVSRLDDRFRLLRSGDRAADERHQTLEGVIAWSHELLTPPDRLLLNRLAVFGQTFSLAAVEAVCTDEELDADDVFDGIGRLVDKSLAQLEVGETRSRYRLLETIRTFGLRRLEEAGRRREMEARLIDWVMQLVDRLEGNMRTERQDETIREATEERAVARTALHLLLAENRRHEALRIVASVPVDVPRERIRLIDELQPSTGGEPSEAAGRANLAAANLAVEMGAMSAGVRYAQAATRMYEDLGDPGNAAWGAFLEAFASWANDDIDGARDAIEDALDTFERLDDPIGLANASWMRASMGTDLDDAHQWSLEAERRCRAVDAPTALAHCLEVRALIALRRHEGDVGGWLAEAMDVFLALRHEGCTAHVLEAVAAATAATHADPGLVAELLGAADRLREISGHDHRPWELEGHEAAVGALASRLDQTEMDRSLERGREHTLDSAGAAARRLLDGIS
jgi:predicted ATPase/class 3 adenylate cyclase